MKILFIQTGGTIDKDYPRITKGYAFEITEPAIQRVIEKINPCFEFEIQSLFKKDSQEITGEDRRKLAETCAQCGYTRIIITHGTDTMIETAQSLGNLRDKVIILTGAMRPERFSNSDADFNIGTAVGAINILEEGVYIAMNGRILRYDKVRRDLTTGQFVEI